MATFRVEDHILDGTFYQCHSLEHIFDNNVLGDRLLSLRSRSLTIIYETNDYYQNGIKFVYMRLIAMISIPIIRQLSLSASMQVIPLQPSQFSPLLSLIPLALIESPPCHIFAMALLLLMRPSSTQSQCNSAISLLILPILLLHNIYLASSVIFL